MERSGNCMLMVPTAIFSTDVGSQCWFTNVTLNWQGCTDICIYFFQLKIIHKALCLFLVRVMLICVCSDPLWLGFHSSWWMRQIVNVSVTKWLYLFIFPAVAKTERVAQRYEGEKKLTEGHEAHILALRGRDVTDRKVTWQFIEACFCSSASSTVIC